LKLSLDDSMLENRGEVFGNVDEYLDDLLDKDKLKKKRMISKKE